MGNEPAIILENVTMKFNLSQEKVDTLKEYVIKVLKKELIYNEFTALSNINLEINKGEIFGIVGYNGSGKSTMLKIIAGVMKPSAGKVVVNGDISPLIELGAGFDPNLTGRENVMLNGLVLGRTEKYMKDNYEKIVDFAEIEDFMDVPLKNYSSGMRARLGFSIATAVNPDILIVDEVLAVGDYKFQEKCEKKITSLFDGGTTVLFVSHSIAQVKKLCSRCLWLDKGVIKMIGESEAVCDAFLDEEN